MIFKMPSIQIHFRILCLFALASVILISGCTANTTNTEPIELSGNELVSVLVFSDPIAYRVMHGISEADYMIFSGDFSDELLSSMNNETFPALRDELISQTGKFVTMNSRASAIKGTDSGVEYFRVTYNARFENHSSVALILVYKSNDPNHMLEGVFFTTDNSQ